MSLYKMIKTNLIFCIRNKLNDARQFHLDIYKSISEMYKIRKRKLSDREIKKIIKTYLGSHSTKFDKDMASLYIGESVNGKLSDSKPETVGSSPVSPVKIKRRNQG